VEKFSKFKPKALLLLILTITIFFFYACKKEPTQWQSEFSVPIASTTISLHHLIADSLLETDANQKLILNFKHPLFQVFTDSMVAFPDTISSYYFRAFGSGNLTPGQTIISQNEVNYFDLGDAQITQLNILEGKIRLYAINPLIEPLKLVYSIPAATKNNIPFTITEVIPASNGLVPYVHDLLIDISGYHLNLKGINGNQYNRLQTSSVLSIYENANTAAVLEGQEFSFYTKFESLSIAYAKGYLGSTLNINGPDSTSIDIFKKISSGNIQLQEVDVWLDIINGIGADLKFKLNELRAINSKNQNAIHLSGSDVFRFQNITRAREDGPWSNSFTPTQKRIAFSNTNIKDLFETLPDILTYSYSYEVNPWGNISGGNDFVYAASKLQAMLNIRVPMSVKLSNLCFADTLEYTMKMENETIENGKLHIRILNSYPMSFDLRVDILNSENQIESTIFNQNSQILSAIPISGSSEIRESLIEINLNKSQIKSLTNNKRMLLFIKANTYNGNTVDLYDFQKMDIKISGDFNLNIKM
jgi:hypothetical protein